MKKVRNVKSTSHTRRKHYRYVYTFLMLIYNNNCIHMQAAILSFLQILQHPSYEQKKTSFWFNLSLRSQYRRELSNQPNLVEISFVVKGCKVEMHFRRVNIDVCLFRGWHKLRVWCFEEHMQSFVGERVAA